MYITGVFNIQKLCIFPVQCIYAFCVVPRTSGGKFPIQH